MKSKVTKNKQICYLALTNTNGQRSHFTTPSSCEWQQPDNKGYSYKYLHFEDKKPKSNILFIWIFTGFTFLWKILTQICQLPQYLKPFIKVWASIQKIFITPFFWWYKSFLCISRTSLMQVKDRSWKIWFMSIKLTIVWQTILVIKCKKTV